MPSTALNPNASQPLAPRSWEVAALVLGLLVLYVPTYLKLNAQVWSLEGQGHGPVMLALVIWLAKERWSALTALPYRSTGPLATVLFVSGLVLYAFGKSMDFAEFESGSQLFLFSALLLFFKGPAGWRVMWFPLFFMLFLIPLPGVVVLTVTAPLKAAVSYVAEAILYQAGYPIGRTGVTLTIGPYKLMVADACAGMNSIFALEAVGVFYMSLTQHVSGLRNILLAIFILPISFTSNVIRVITLVLVTYYFGDEAGQGFVHGFAGILLFVVATLLTIFVDNILGLFRSLRGPKTAP